MLTFAAVMDECRAGKETVLYKQEFRNHPLDCFC